MEGHRNNDEQEQANSRRLEVISRQLCAMAIEGGSRVPTVPPVPGISFCPRAMEAFLVHDNHELRKSIHEFLKVCSDQGEAGLQAEVAHMRAHACNKSWAAMLRCIPCRVPCTTQGLCATWDASTKLPLVPAHTPLGPVADMWHMHSAQTFAWKNWPLVPGLPPGKQKASLA